METSDQELLRRIAAGDRDAFATFYDRHAARVHGLLVRWLGGPGDAEDVLQVTFWQVWNQASRYDPQRSPPDVWVLLLARSRALDLLRRQRPGPAAEAIVEPTILADPVQSLMRTEAAQRVRELLHRLPEEQRLAIHLAFFVGLTHDQIAARLGWPLGTVKTRIRLGMQRLRSLLREPQEVSAP